mgnify:CR=1 FL=1
MSQFKIEISSVPDKEKLVAEIWYNDIMIAEINQETKELLIEFFVAENISFPLDDFLKILEIAKSKLLPK